MIIKNPVIRKTLSLGSYLLIAMVVAFLIADRHSPTLAIGSSAPINEKLILEDGTITTVKQRLKKPLLINFWASFCPPCLKELPTLGKMANKYKGKVVFLGAAVSTKPADIAHLKKRFLLDYDMALVTDAVVDKWQASALPTSYLIDLDGKILWAKAGIASESDLEYAFKLVANRPAP